MNTSALNTCLSNIITDGYASSIAVRYGRGHRILGDVYAYSTQQIGDSTLFDIASITKIVATTSLALIAVDKGLIDIGDKIDKFYPCNDENKNTTIGNLLTHTFGIGHKSICKPGVTYKNVAEYIINIPKDFEVGSKVEYSCPAFMLLGKILEKVYDMPLNESFLKYVAEPLKMDNTCFLPERETVNSNIRSSENGLVNDYNCRFLGGISGNAGLFSTMHDMTEYVQMLANYGAPLIKRQTFKLATENHTKDLEESRGLGFVYVDKRYSQVGDLFPEGSIGHCGHTGQSVFINPKTGFYAIILSDMTVSTVKKFREERYGEVMRLRAEIHNAIKEDLERN